MGAGPAELWTPDRQLEWVAERGPHAGREGWDFDESMDYGLPGAMSWGGSPGIHGFYCMWEIPFFPERFLGALHLSLRRGGIRRSRISRI